MGLLVAFSVAPLMAILIWLLARFMRHDDRRDNTSNDKPGIVDRVMAGGARVVSFLVDVLFWPVQVVYAGIEWLIRRLRVASGRRPEEPILKPSSASSGGMVARVALLVPFLIFVLFPFFWIIITSLKSTNQISERRSLFWPGGGRGCPRPAVAGRSRSAASPLPSGSSFTRDCARRRSAARRGGGR